MNKLEKLKNSYFASCPIGLEDELFKEIKDLKIREKRRTRGGVYFGGMPKDFLRVIFYSRIASRVFRRPYKFNITHEKDLYSYGRQIKWKAIFDLNQSFKIRTLLGHSEDGKKQSRFGNSIYLSQLLKDAIVDHFREEFSGERPNVDLENPDVEFLLYIEPRHGSSDKEEASLLIDLCGEALFHRGHRKSTGIAPLNENLAAGIIRKMNLQFEKPKDIFIDGMCGTGTVLIQAILEWSNIPPSYLQVEKLLKNSQTIIWSFQKLTFFKKSNFLLDHFEFFKKKVHSETQRGMEKLKKRKKCFYAIDIDNSSLSATEENLRESHLSPFVEIKKADITNWVPERSTQGYIFCNPPYGKRLGESDEELVNLYFKLGENLKKNFKGFNAFILTGNADLRKAISLTTQERIPFWNGPIECRLLHYSLY